MIVGLSHDKLSVRRGSTLQELEDGILGQYSRVPLGRIDFTFARARKGRQLEPFRGDTLEDLEVFIGKGKLIILPKRDLAVPSPQPSDEVSVTACIFHHVSLFSLLVDSYQLRIMITVNASTNLSL